MNTSENPTLESSRSTEEPFDVVIVGAGVAGLTLAGRLREEAKAHGRPVPRVVVLDKGRSVGGRMGTRRLEWPEGGEPARFDHGPPGFSVITAAFRKLVERAEAAGAVLPHPEGQRLHWRGREGVRSFAAFLAEGVEVRSSTIVTAVRPDLADPSLWSLATTPAAPGLKAPDISSAPLDPTAPVTTLRARAVVLTCPVPQALAILEAGGVALASDLRADLAVVSYERSWVALATFNEQDGQRLADLGPEGLVVVPEELPHKLIDHRARGVSPRPAYSIQAGANWSMTHWDDPADQVAPTLFQAARPWLGGSEEEVKPVHLEAHRWKFARVTVGFPRTERYATLNDAPPLLMAGDAFRGGAQAGPDSRSRDPETIYGVEAAWLSGQAAAAALEGRV
jgi:predicted NAD/FAD-dependent oxidoreductase